MNINLQVVIEDFEEDLEKAAEEVFYCYEKKVLRSETGVGGIPFDTGQLKDGLKITSKSVKKNNAEAVFESTTKSDTGFDYPAFLDQSGVHEGWWRTVNTDQVLEQCLRQVMPRYNL